MIDTVDLYFIKARQRRLSLKFLSWFVLKQDIQQEEHDSIEDARSALLLYKAYLEFEKQGIFDQKLEELYREGKGVVSTRVRSRQLILLNFLRIGNLLWQQKLHLPHHSPCRASLSLRRLGIG